MASYIRSDLLYFLSVGFLSSLFNVTSPSFSTNYKPCLILDIDFFKCQSAFLTHCLMVNVNFFIVTAFSNSPLSGKRCLPIKNSYLATFPGDKAEILPVCLSKSY